mgnify:CR=1 FL=1
MLGPIDLHAIMKHSYRNTFNFKKTSLKDEMGHILNPIWFSVLLETKSW